MPLQTDYLTPPVLTSAHIGHTVLCHRPVRALMPAMTAGRFGTQIIACNYGHAGFGWIMAPGSTSFVLDQMTTLVNAQAKKQAITIVGAGIMGLMAAYQLLERGYHDITVVAQEHTNLTSHKAVGFFSPTIELGKSWITQDIKTIVRASYTFYQDILAGRQPNFAPSSLLQLPMYTAKPNLNGIILSPSPAQRVIIDFGTGAAHEVIKQEGGLLIHVNVMMQQLAALLTKHGVRFETQVLERIEDAQTPIVINCAGLGAGKLMHDTSMVPAQGHLVHLTNQPPEALRYLLMLEREKKHTGTGFQVKRSVYLAPRHHLDNPHGHDALLGATSIRGADETTPHHEEFERVLEQAHAYFYGR